MTAEISILKSDTTPAAVVRTGSYRPGAAAKPDHSGNLCCLQLQSFPSLPKNQRSEIARIIDYCKK
jgi:hypothetical protein